METLSNQDVATKQNYRLEFFGKGSEYFSIMIVNWLLTLVTVGLYYPWARAKSLRYIHGQTALNNERFHFSGTGNEMFKGFIKLILFYIVMLGIFLLFSKVLHSPVGGIIILYLGMFTLIPFAIHGSMRYRTSRTSYRGIRFGYRGDRNEFIKNFYKWTALTIVTFGIYGFWMQANVRRYTHENTRYGDVHFSNDIDGGDWLILNLKGYFLTVITLGIYGFWWQRDIFANYVDNLKMTRGNEKINCHSTATAGGFFELLLGNLFITVFTLGFGKAWADMRTQKFICDNIKLEGNINIDTIKQTEEEYKDAFGDDVVDFLEIDIA